MTFDIIRNDITNMDVDAIVLPANSQLREGSGTSNAIFEKAGRKQLTKACQKLKPVNIGDSVPTLGYNLNSKFILHTVVPKWIDGTKQEYELLSASYLSALSLADAMGCESIAFPLLASGHNGFDPNLSFTIAQNTIESYESNNKLQKIILVVYDRDTMSMLRSLKIDVEELIDETYILQKDENYKLPILRTYEEGKELAEKFLEDALQMAKEYLDDSQHRKEILQIGAQIAVDAIQQIKHTEE